MHRLRQYLGGGTTVQQHVVLQGQGKQGEERGERGVGGRLGRARPLIHLPWELEPPPHQDRRSGGAGGEVVVALCYPVPRRGGRTGGRRGSPAPAPLSG